MATCQHHFSSAEVNGKLVCASTKVFPDSGTTLQINTYCIFCDPNIARETQHKAEEEVTGRDQKKELLQHVINTDSTAQRFKMGVCCLFSSTSP